MATKPSFPADYTIPQVWQPVDGPEAFAGMNRPTAGARFEKDLPKGKHPIQLYSLGTPNGQKATIMLEELGIEYDAWLIEIMKQDQFGSSFVQVNPNSKIPALLDYSGSKPVRVFESVSILIYLADKYKKFIPQDFEARTECMNWLIWQVGTAPYIGGGFGHFYKYAPIQIQYAVDRFSMETKRIVDVLEKHLEGKEYVMGSEYTIADMAIFPWIRCIEKGYNAGEFLQTHEYKNVQRWIKTLEARPAVQRGLRVNGFGPDALKERHSKEDFEKSAL
ncbi:glutathione S-transferase [Gorgonomyces haynaldii]|nr:glutathione S-transferase [Gorgonomyces haynaldii]